ncbi:MAG: hypothetical protein HZB29_12660 [Nitrospinae bacterium]|nr:hypothetical protein [Nitrospinota bacterium]
MIKRLFMLAVSAAIVLAFGPAAHATPLKQIWIPSTDVEPFKSVHLDVDLYTTMFKKIKDGGHTRPVTLGLTVGVLETQFIDGEIGVDFKEATDEPTFFNAKLAIKEDSLLTFFPAIAFGAYDMGTKQDVTDYNIFYVLASKTIAPLGRLSAGYYVGNDKLLRNTKNDKENNGALLSFDRTLAEINKNLWVAVDYMSGQNVYGALSFGLGWRFSPNISAIAGYNAYNERKLAGEDTFTIQFDMDF